MSIFNDPRRYSDDNKEYLAWAQEVVMECRREERKYENYDDDLVIDLDDAESEEGDGE